MPKKVHRGRSKAHTTPITIRLTAEEIEALDALADANLRTRTGQAAWIVLEALYVATPLTPPMEPCPWCGVDGCSECRVSYPGALTDPKRND